MSPLTSRVSPFASALLLAACAATGAGRASTAGGGQREPSDRPSTGALPKVIFFDSNETLLDLAPLQTSVGQALDGREDLLAIWFSTMLHYSLVDTVTGEYHDFADIGVAALMTVAQNNDVEISEEEARAAIVPPQRSLPPGDVRPGLEVIRSQGFTMVTLTTR